MVEVWQLVVLLQMWQLVSMWCSPPSSCGVGWCTSNIKLPMHPSDSPSTIIINMSMTKPQLLTVMPSSSTTLGAFLVDTTTHVSSKSTPSYTGISIATMRLPANTTPQTLSESDLYPLTLFHPTSIMKLLCIEMITEPLWD